MNVDQFFRDYISTWEGGLSLDPVDRGNWYQGKLIGSNHGVTGAVLAAFRGTAVITAADMKALTLDEAARIGATLFFHQPGLDKLPWDPVIASAVDFGWGAGPKHGAMIVQQLAGVPQDGAIGPLTISSYKSYCDRIGLEEAAHFMETARNAYYDAVIARIPADAKYRNGWRNRSHYFSAGGEWWKRFMA